MHSKRLLNVFKPMLIVLLSLLKTKLVINVSNGLTERDRLVLAIVEIIGGEIVEHSSDSPSSELFG